MSGTNARLHPIHTPANDIRTRSTYQKKQASGKGGVASELMKGVNTNQRFRQITINKLHNAASAQPELGSTVHAAEMNRQPACTSQSGRRCSSNHAFNARIHKAKVSPYLKGTPLALIIFCSLILIALIAWGVIEARS